MNLNKLAVVEALEGLKAKKFSSVSLVSTCFDQIEKHDGEVRAFVTLVKTDALIQAKKADELIAKDGEKAFDEKPLLGIPYACKDIFCTKGVETTASSNILKDFIPPYESTVTKRLSDAGAILIGKTNMDAFAHGASTEVSDFFTTKNPWDKTRLPGGSSGGSAAAVISDMCTFAIGSDTGGSIRCPASWCSVVGLKPSYGRVSRYGAIAMASSTDCPGPMTKTVEDAAIILKILAGKDPFDATSSPKEVADYVSLFDDIDLKGLKIGKPSSYFDIDFEGNVADVVEGALEKFASLGAKIVDIDLLHPKYAIAVYTIIQRSEVSSNLARFDGVRFGHSRDAFGFEARNRMMLGAYTLSVGYYDAYYSQAQRVRTLIKEGFEKAFEKVDVIVGPTMPNLPVPLGSTKGKAMFGEKTDMMQIPGSMAGLPVVSVPCGFDKGLPVSFQIIGPMFEEGRILGVANKYQKVTDFHKERPKL